MDFSIRQKMLHNTSTNAQHHLKNFSRRTFPKKTRRGRQLQTALLKMTIGFNSFRDHFDRGFGPLFSETIGFNSFRDHFDRGFGPLFSETRNFDKIEDFHTLNWISQFAKRCFTTLARTRNTIWKTLNAKHSRKNKTETTIASCSSENDNWVQ